MAHVALAQRAYDDLERLVEFLAVDDPRAAAEALELILEALQVLARHPLIGRPVENGLHELVISQGRTGYVALFDFYSDEDTVMVLAVRHQREAGFEPKPE